MHSEPLSPQAWLAAQPLHVGQHLYAVLGNASAAEPLVHYYQRSSTPEALPLWQDTPYARWHSVMPYLAELDPSDPFLDWIATQDTADWGWLAVSSQPITRVREHLRSLTQVLMPDGTATFFRFWDGHHLLPILHQLGAGFTAVLPVFERYLIQGEALVLPATPWAPVRDFPCWTVPAPVLDTLGADDPTTLVDNLLQWLQREAAPLYFQLPAANLRLKVERFVRRNTLAAARDPQRLKTLLMDEFVR